MKYRTGRQAAWTDAYKAGLLNEKSHPRDNLEVEQLMVYLNRAKVHLTRTRAPGRSLDNPG